MTIKNILQLLIISAILLIITLFFSPRSHAFYDILKITICGTFAILSYKQIKSKNLNLLNIAIAVIYNPFIPIGFRKDSWELINSLTLFYCFCIFIIYFRKQQIVNKSDDTYEQVNAILKSVDAVFDNGGIKEESDELMKDILSKVIIPAGRLHSKGEGPKFKLNDRIEKIYMCEHLLDNDNTTTNTAFKEKYTLKDIYQMFDGDLYFMVCFITGNNSFEINMSAFRQYILPQLKKELGKDLLHIIKHSSKPQ